MSGTYEIVETGWSYAGLVEGTLRYAYALELRRGGREIARLHMSLGHDEPTGALPDEWAAAFADARGHVRAETGVGYVDWVATTRDGIRSYVAELTPADADEMSDA